MAELVRLIREVVGSRAVIAHVPPGLALFLTRLAGLLVSKGPPTGHTRLSEWLRENAGTVGVGYASELARHYR